MVSFHHLNGNSENWRKNEIIWILIRQCRLHSRLIGRKIRERDVSKGAKVEWKGKTKGDSRKFYRTNCPVELSQFLWSQGPKVISRREFSCTRAIRTRVFFLRRIKFSIQNKPILYITSHILSNFQRRKFQHRQQSSFRKFLSFSKKKKNFFIKNFHKVLEVYEKFS